MPCPFPIFSQSDYLIQVVDINSNAEWQTVQIQISWLLQKPTDLDLHCLQRQGISGFSRTRVKANIHTSFELLCTKNSLRSDNGKIYPEYLETSTLYHTCSKIWTSTVYYSMLCLKIARWVANSVDPDKTCGVPSGSTMFAQAGLSEYIQ